MLNLVFPRFLPYLVFDNSTASLRVKRFVVASTSSPHRQIKSFSFLQRNSQWVFLLSCCPQQHPVGQWTKAKIVYETDESPPQLCHPSLNQCACVVHTQWPSYAPSFDVWKYRRIIFEGPSSVLTYHILTPHFYFKHNVSFMMSKK